MKPEKEVQSDIIKYCKEKNILAIKIIKSNINGTPDLLLIKNNIYLLLEIKTQVGTVSRIQQSFINKAKELYNVDKIYVITSSEQAKIIIEETWDISENIKEE